jgi:hypothetical protein
MSNMEYVDKDKLRKWEADFLKGNYSSDNWAVSALENGVDEEGTSMLFFVPQSKRAFEFIVNNGVDIVRQDADGYTLLHDATFYDLDTFRYLAEIYALRDAIDMAEHEGVTPLSSHIKRGRLDYARVLLDHGASVDTFATIARYGGTRLDLPMQAVNSLAGGPEEDQELAAIQALNLLKEFGLSVSNERKANLLLQLEKKPKVGEWVRRNM